MQSGFYFRIDEIREAPNIAGSNKPHGEPPITTGANVTVHGGASYKWWLCDGRQIRQVPNVASNSNRHSTYSVFYSGGFGFWVLRGDATNPTPGDAWQPLCFDHVPNDNYSSYLCNVAKTRTVACRRPDQSWLPMLLPDIYYKCVPETSNRAYGGLKGELAIFLALVAFAMKPEVLPTMLPNMFSNGSWQVYSMQQGWQDKRGVTVYVYTIPGHSKEELVAYDWTKGYYN